MRLAQAFCLISLTLSPLRAREFGPAIGSRMPQFELRDQDGNVRNLNSLLGGKGAVILLFRSADW